jgi:putative transposase
MSGQCPSRKPAKDFGRLWARFKTEELAARPQPYFADLADARASVATYFDYYNYAHRHSVLAYQTPQFFYLQ